MPSINLLGVVLVSLHAISIDQHLDMEGTLNLNFFDRGLNVDVLTMMQQSKSSISISDICPCSEVLIDDVKMKYVGGAVFAKFGIFFPKNCIFTYNFKSIEVMGLILVPIPLK